MKGEVKCFREFKKKNLRGVGSGGGVEGWGSRGVRSGLGWGRLGSKVWGRWVMWGMGDVNQEL